MKKLVLATALLGMAGMASAFNQPQNSGGDFATTSIIRNTLGAAPNGGDLATVTTPGVTPAAAGLILVSKVGNSLVMEFNRTGFIVAQRALAGLGTVDSDGNLIITGSNLDSLAQSVGVNPADVTARTLVIRQSGAHDLSVRNLVFPRV